MKLRKNLSKFIQRKKKFVSVLEKTLHYLMNMVVKKRKRKFYRSRRRGKVRKLRKLRKDSLRYHNHIVNMRRKRRKERRRKLKLSKYKLDRTYNRGALFNLLKRK